MALEKKGTKLIRATRPADGASWLPLTPIDIKMPTYQMPMVVAFLRPPSSDFLVHLEKGLETVLTHYTLLAGRVEGAKLRLTNEGVPLTQATVDMELKNYLELGFEHLHQLTPASDDITIPFMVQVTEFSCGCVTLGMARLHNVVDSNAYPSFLKDLADTVRLGHPVLSPVFLDRSCMMPRDPPLPTLDHPEYNLPSHPQAAKAAIVTTMIHFTSQRLAALKSESNAGNTSPVPFSTYVSLSAFLWRALTKVRGEANTLCICPVNGRRTLSLPPDYFGNVVFRACAKATSEELLSKPLSYAAALIDAAIKKSSNPESMRSVIDLLAIQQKNSLRQSLRRANLSLSPIGVITSWARLPIYDIDFGFGAPALAAPTILPWEGYITVAPSSKRDGSLNVVASLFQHHLDGFLSLVS